MTARLCHALKGNKGTEAPSSWVFFDTESWPDASEGAGRVIRHKLRLGSAYAVRIEGGRRTREHWLDFQEPGQFWQFVFSRLSDHRPTWLVAHNLSFDFPLVDGFKLLTSYGLENWKLVLGPPTTVMRGKPDGRSVCIVDGLNYVRASIAQIGRWLGKDKGTMPPFTAPDTDWWTYCRRDVEILADAVLEVVALHRTHNLGVVGRTAAQCAMHAYRHRWREGRILFHDDEEALMWERSCYYGGRVECNYVGAAAGPVYQLDVNSLYPSVMRDTELPCRLVSKYEEPPVKWLRERLEMYDGAARVLIDSATHTYPFRPPKKGRAGWLPAVALSQMPEQAWQGRTLYTRGVFPTWLCGEELRRALARGHVLRVRRAALYERATLFRKWVDWWYPFRVAARDSGNGLHEYLAKAYLNSLAGVWAKRAPRWVAAPDEVPPHPWAKWSMYDAIEGRTRLFRAIGNVPQEEVEEGEPFDSAPIISACITACARERLRDLQALVGARHWFYEDTDSLMVDADGLDTLLLHGQVGNSRLGALRVEVEGAAVTINGVKDYELGGKVVLKGARADAVWLDGNRCQQWEWHHLKWALARRGESVATVALRELHFHRGYLKGAIGPDGWTQPYDLMIHPELDW